MDWSCDDEVLSRMCIHVLSFVICGRIRIPCYHFVHTESLLRHRYIPYVICKKHNRFDGISIFMSTLHWRVYGFALIGTHDILH